MLPRPLGLAPFHYVLEDHLHDVAKHISASGKMVVDVLGDSGGVKDAQFQSNVANQMVKALGKAGPGTPHFCYHVGDVIYFTGAHDDYYSQFYEAYEQYTRPIFAIPGNHDGEVDDPTVQIARRVGGAFHAARSGCRSDLERCAARWPESAEPLLDTGYTAGHVCGHVHEGPGTWLDRLKPADVADE